MSLIVERLKQLVKKSGISQIDLAEKLDIDRSYLSKLLNNKEGINTKYVEQMLETLGFTLADLVDVPDANLEKRISALESRIDALEVSAK